MALSQTPHGNSSGTMLTALMEKAGVSVCNFSLYSRIKNRTRKCTLHLLVTIRKSETYQLIQNWRGKKSYDRLHLLLVPTVCIKGFFSWPLLFQSNISCGAIFSCDIFPTQNIFLVHYTPCTICRTIAIQCQEAWSQSALISGRALTA